MVVLWWLLAVHVPRPFFPREPAVELEIPLGTGFRNAAELLAESGIIPSSRAFLVLGYLRRASGRIKAGRYEFSLPTSSVRVLDDLLRGKVKLYQISIPEGYNMYQIADALEREQITGREEFIRAARDHALLTELGITAGSTEGYLYPDTYFFDRGMSPEEVIRVMAERFGEIFQPLWEKARTASPAELSRHEVVTLASLIEKETSAGSERPLISAVFYNRLRKKMRLDCDPTVIYGIWEEFTGNLRREDLARRNPYNTYRKRGLPPGPIASPGRESLQAALFPATAPYLFFVSRGDGTHYFSTTLSEHNRAVNSFQRGKR